MLTEELHTSEKKRIISYAEDQSTLLVHDDAEGILFNIPIGSKGATFGELLDVLCEYGREITDIKIEAGKPVWFKVDGSMRKYEKFGIVSKECARKLVETLVFRCTSEDTLNSYIDGTKTDFDISFRHIKTTDKGTVTGRFRFLAMNAYDGWAMGGRIIMDNLPDASMLSLPKSLFDAVLSESGIILVTGPQGSGKTTTLSALLQYVLDSQPRNILSLEDPVEFKFKDNIGTITQREIGRNVPSFKMALKSSLRYNTSIVHITELRDPDVIREAINSSEQNILIMASLHTNSVAHTAERILGAFPVLEQEVIAASFAEQIKLIVNQRLVPCYVISGYDWTGAPIYETEDIDGHPTTKIRRKAVFELVYATEKIQAAIRMNRPGDILDGIYDEARKDSTGSLGINLLNRELTKLIKSWELPIVEAIKATYDKKNLAMEVEAAGFDIHDEYFWPHFAGVELR